MSEYTILTLWMDHLALGGYRLMALAGVADGHAAGNRWQTNERRKSIQSPPLADYRAKMILYYVQTAYDSDESIPPLLELQNGRWHRLQGLAAAADKVRGLRRS